MNCTEVTEQLHLFVDRLDQMPEELVAHIEGCKRCEKLYRELVHLDAAIAADGQVPFPPDSYFAGLHDAVMAQIAAQPQQHLRAASRPSGRSFWALLGWRPVVSGAVALALVAAAVWLQPWSLLREDQAVESSSERLSQAVPPSPHLPAEAMSPPPESAAAGEAAKPPSASSVEEKVAATPPPTLDEAGQAAGQPRLLATQESLGDTPKGSRQAVAVPDVRQQRADSEQVLPDSELNALTGARKRAAELAVPAERPSNLKASAVKFESAHKSDSFTASLRAAQNAERPAQRIEIWKAFLAAEHDSTRMEYLMGQSQLAEAIYEQAVSSGELLDLADAVAWYEKRASQLKPLVGEAIFQQRLEQLRKSLQAARTRGAASPVPENQQ